MWDLRRLFIVALAIRLALAPFATLSATFENITAVDTIFVQGFNPLSWITSYGTGFYLFYVPVYVPYVFLNILGVHSLYILEFLFKLPSIIGDLVSGYALFNLASIVLHDSGRAKTLAAVYLLNPYTIFISAVVGHLEPLMIGLVLNSMVWALRQNTLKSAMTLSLASTLRFLPGLLLPFFLIYMRKQSPRSLKPYFYSFVGLSAIMFSPYFLVLVQLGLASQPLLVTYLQSFAGPVSTLGHTNPVTFKYNLTGFLASTGLWGYASEVSNFWAFIAAYVGLIAVFWRLSGVNFKALTSFAGILFSTFMLIIPLSQPHYLSWFLPFALIGSFVYDSFPRRFVGLLISANMAIWPIIDPGFLITLDATFPWLGGYDSMYNRWPFYNTNLQLSLSVLYGIILAFCLITLLVGTIWSRRSIPSSTPRFLSRQPVLVIGQILLLIIETLRLAYFQAEANLWAIDLLIAIGIVTLYIAQFRHDRGFTFAPPIKNAIGERGVFLVLSVLFAALALMSDSLFLLVQGVFLTFLALTGRLNYNSTVTQIITVWSGAYVAYLSLISTSSVESALTIPTLFLILFGLLIQFYNGISLRAIESLETGRR